MTIAKEDFEYVSSLTRDNAAIVLETGKEYLVESRLEPLSRSSGYESLSSMIQEMRDDRTLGEIHLKAIEALTTNETSFFRDLHPFEAMKNHLIPELIKENVDRRITIWSGASSTGQEAYSISMMIRESFPELASWNVSIVGTDLSRNAVSKAKEGTYTQFEVNRGLPLPMLVKYFEKVGSDWQIKKEIRDMVDFRVMNLIKPWPLLLQFDIVLMRNVLIYFDVESKRQILAGIRKVLKCNGALFLGASETTLNIDRDWEVSNCGKTLLYRITKRLNGNIVPEWN